MDDLLIQIIKDKAFHELDASEKLMLKDWCEGEEEFNRFKFIFSEMDAIKVREEVKLNSGVKNSLDALFISQHSKERRFFLNLPPFLFKSEEKWYRQPLFHIAALLVVIVTVFNTLKLDQMDSIQVAQIVRKPTEKDKNTTITKTEKNEIQPDSEQQQRKIKSVLHQEKIFIPEKIEADLEITENVTVFSEENEASYLPIEDNIDAMKSASSNASKVALSQAEPTWFNDSNEIKYLDSDDANGRIFSTTFSTAMGDNAIFQVKPVSIQMLDVLYTIY